MRIALAAAAAALAALALAGPASADSIAYINDGNVYLTTPTGDRQFQVTRDGGYGYVSQADDGTMIALYGRRLRRLARDGSVLADFATPVSDTAAGSSFEFRGPLDPVISPDGTKVAYGYNAHYTTWDPNCPYGPNGCYAGKVFVGTGYSHADRLTGWDEPGYGKHSGWQWPSWIDNQRVLITDPAEALNDYAWVDTFGDDQYGQDWFGNYYDYSLRDGEVNRQGDGAAFVSSQTELNDLIRIFRVTQPIPAAPEECLWLKDPEGGGFSSPSFSPDGHSLAYDDGAGVWVMRGIDLTACTPGGTSVKLVPGGHDPDWGPADVPQAAAPPAPKVPEAPKYPQVAPPDVPKQPDVPATERLRIVVEKAKAARMLARGLAIGVKTGRPGTVSAQAQVRARRVGSGKARIGASGSGRVLIRFTAEAQRALRRGGSLRITVTFRPTAGGSPETTRTAVRIRR